MKNVPDEIMELLKAPKNLESKIKYNKLTRAEIRETNKQIKEKRSYIFSLLIQIPNYEYQIILIERYINLKHWDYIAKILNFATNWVKTNRHLKAVEEFAKIYYKSK